MRIINSHLGGGVGGGDWTPAEIATSYWVDFSNPATLFDATTGGSVVDADGPVARADDLSGNSRHPIQANSTYQPIRKVAALQGRDCLRFSRSSGIPHHLVVPFGVDIQAFSLFIFGRSDTDEGMLLSQRSVSIRIYINRDRCLVGTSPFVSYSSGAASTPSVFSLIADVGDKSAEVNGNPVAAFTDFYSGSVTQMLIGAGPDPAGAASSSFGQFMGDIGEVVAIAAAVESDDRARVTGYLAHKWGVADSLPAEHPYKSAPP